MPSYYRVCSESHHFETAFALERLRFRACFGREFEIADTNRSLSSGELVLMSSHEFVKSPLHHCGGVTRNYSSAISADPLIHDVRHQLLLGDT